MRPKLSFTTNHCDPYCHTAYHFACLVGVCRTEDLAEVHQTLFLTRSYRVCMGMRLINEAILCKTLNMLNCLSVYCCLSLHAKQATVCQCNYKYKNNNRWLKSEVGMAVLKIKRTRIVGIHGISLCLLLAADSFHCTWSVPVYHTPLWAVELASIGVSLLVLFTFLVLPSLLHSSIIDCLLYLSPLLSF